MKWLEILLLRTAEIPKPSDDKFARIVGSLSSPGLIQAVLHRHASIVGDFALALHWDTEEPISRGSDLAQSLKHELKHQGLVDHSVWIPLEGTKQ
jgi:hypothetical protein